jgi:hypothetical protein
MARTPDTVNSSAVRGWGMGTFGLLVANAALWLYALGLPVKLLV